MPRYGDRLRGDESAGLECPKDGPHTCRNGRPDQGVATGSMRCERACTDPRLKPTLIGASTR